MGKETNVKSCLRTAMIARNTNRIRNFSHVFFLVFYGMERISDSPSYPDKNSAVWIGLYGLLGDCCAHESVYHHPMLFNVHIYNKSKTQNPHDLHRILTIFHPTWPSQLAQWISAISVWVLRPASLTWMDVTLAGASVIALLPSNLTFKPLP